MRILIDYKPPYNIDILSRYGSIEYESKNMTIVVLNTNESIENIKKIEGVSMVYMDRLFSWQGV